MAITSFWKCGIFATLMLFVSTASGTSDNGVCSRTLYQRTSRQESIRSAYNVYYNNYYSCGFLWLSRCSTTVSRPAYRKAYKTVYYSQAYGQNYCCSGYIGTAPHCQRVCPSLPSYVSYGKVIVNSTFVGGTAMYNCRPGYRVDGAAVLTCQSDGSWNNTIPRCRRACPVLKGIADGAVSKTDRDFAGSEASYSCSYGYGMVGGSTLTCLSSREWNGSPPECYKLIMCPRLDDPANGTTTLENRTNGVDSLVSYGCLAGYALVGSDSRTCQMNGTWTRFDPQCQRICPTLRAPSNGNVNISDYFVGGTANFACNEGFGILGSGQIICEADGLWNQQPPVCDPVCSVPTKPDNGIIISDEPYFIESNATFACEDGFGVNGNGSITCLSNLTWSGSSPTCDRVCGPLKQLLNSALTVNSYFYNSEAIYQCNEGFIFKFPGSKAESRLTYCCLHDDNSDHLLEWVGDYDVAPDCERFCPIQRAPRNGDVTVSDYFVGGTANFACDEGFGMIGSGQIICEADGIWSQQPPACDPVCPVPTKPDNGIIMSDGPYFIESNATFACEDGFGVNGDRNITCLSDLTWSGSSPTCDHVCGPLKQVLNGAVTVDSYFYNAEATYQCNEGFNFKFSGSQTESPLTYCCLHAEYSDHLLEWVGDYDVVPDCEPIECSTRRLRLRYGTVSMTSHYYGGIVTYVCSYGYKLSNGPRTRRCSKDRIWEPRISPSCTEIPGNCSSIQQITAPVNGEVLITSHLYGGSAKYKCNDGFTLMGDGIRNCTEDESTVKWSGSEPQCINTEPNTESPEDVPE